MRETEVKAHFRDSNWLYMDFWLYLLRIFSAPMRLHAIFALARTIQFYKKKTALLDRKK